MDGTLLEIAPTPDSVTVDAQLKRLLADVALALDGALALVSGRAIAALDRLFDPQRWPAATLSSRRKYPPAWRASTSSAEPRPPSPATRVRTRMPTQ